MTDDDEEQQPSAGDDDEVRDALPADLDVTEYVGPYTFPDTKRRRIAATLYAVIALLSLWAGLATGNEGFIAAAIIMGLVSLYCFAAAWPLRVDQTEALAAASRTVGFPVGHAS